MPDTFAHHLSTSALSTDGCDGAGARLRVFGAWRPRAALTVPVADRVRFALMRACSGSIPSQVLGKDASGRPLIGHRHLYTLPIGRPGADAKLEDILLWTRHGLEPDTLAMLDVLAERGGHLRLDQRAGLRLEVLERGGPEVLATSLSRVFGPASVWRSVTPFVAPRYGKYRRGRRVDEPAEQIATLLAENYAVVPTQITPMTEPAEHWRGFVQRRFKDPRSPSRHASGWILHFAAPISGPIVLGHGAHFGLGRFEAVPS